MSPVAWIIVVVLAYLGLGKFVISGFRPRSQRRLTPIEDLRRARPLDITCALRRKAGSE